MADSATTPEEPVVMDGDVIVEFNEATSRQQINSGESVKTLFGKLRKFLTDLKAVAFTGAYSDLSGTPDLTQYASKAKYGDTTIDVGRKAGTTVGEYSTAEGIDTTAMGNYSHSEGMETSASGAASHAEGYRTYAVGYDSHSGGYATTARGNISFAHGYHVISKNDYEIALGKCNVSTDNSTLFSIGNGTDENTRHNAFEITTTGGKLHDKDIATTDIIPDLSEYAKTADVPNIKVNEAVNADTVGGISPEEISTTPIKSTGWITTPTNEYGKIVLPNSDSRGYISVTVAGCYNQMYMDNGNYVFGVTDGAFNPQVNTAISYIAYYIE